MSIMHFLHGDLQDSFLVVLVYIDDIIVANSFLQAVTDFKRSLNDKFKIKDLDLLKYFLVLRLQGLPKVFSYVRDTILWRF